MMIDFTEYAIYLRPGRTDMRKHSATLSMLVCQEMGLDPFEKAVFVFCGSGNRMIKAIFWDRNDW